MSNHMVICQQFARRRFSKGINLIEIMVSMAIGLFLVLGATTLYVNTKKTSDVDDATARLQETARYAMSVLETDVRMANYWGLSKDGSTSFTNSISNEVSDNADAGNSTAAADSNDVSKALSTSPTAGACGTTTAFDVEHYLAATGSYTLPSSCAAKSGALDTANTLTVRRASITVSTRDANKLQVCASRSGTAEILTASMSCANEIHDLSTNIYYVDKQSDQGTDVPSLRRKTLESGPAFKDQEVIAGVEDMQIELGWAPPNAFGNPTSSAVMYLPPGNAALALAGSQVVAVRIWLLIRAETADPSFTNTRSYSYAKRTGTPATTNLTSTTDAAKQYLPTDHYRRLGIMRTFFIRNVVGT